MNPSGASSQTSNNIRKKIGPAVWLLVLLFAGTKDTVNAT
jgi:hypothetical protein